MHPLMTILLAVVSATGAAQPRAGQPRRATQSPPAATSHVRRQFYPASALPFAGFSPSGGFHGSPFDANYMPYATSTNYHPMYAAPTFAASTYLPTYEEPEDEYIVEETEDEPVYLTDSVEDLLLDAGASPEVYETVVYRRPETRAPLRRPPRRAPRRPPTRIIRARPRPPPPRRQPYVLRITKKRIIRD